MRKEGYGSGPRNYDISMNGWIANTRLGTSIPQCTFDEFQVGLYVLFIIVNQ